MRKEILIGVFAAILATFCGFYVYVEFVSPYGYDQTINMIAKGKLFGKVLSLAALPNLLVFFVFLKKNKDYRARGVLLATMLTAITVMILKFV